MNKGDGWLARVWLPVHPLVQPLVQILNPKPPPLVQPLVQPFSPKHLGSALLNATCSPDGGDLGSKDQQLAVAASRLFGAGDTVRRL